MTPLDVALHDEAKRIVAPEELGRQEMQCTCQTCGATALLLRAKLLSRGVFAEDARRVSIKPFDCRSASYPYVASVRVDGREVYRIMERPDEVFAPEVLEDITKALRRPM